MQDSYAVELGQYDFSPVFREIVQPILDLFYTSLFTALSIFLAMLLYAVIKYRINFFRITSEDLKGKVIKFKPFNFLRWLYIDLVKENNGEITFKEHGFTLFCGRQGAGKTISMIEYLNRMRKQYPKAIIVTNFGYKYSDHIMKDWRDFFKYRNGTDGVIFAIDEIHSEFSTAKSKDFPESILSEISQQRKQRMKIVATAQVYSRVAKPIREQAMTVMQCSTFANRWTATKEYDATEYENETNAAAVKKKVRPIGRYSFVQEDELRECFDTYEKIERLTGMDFIEKEGKYFNTKYPFEDIFIGGEYSGAIKTKILRLKNVIDCEAAQDLANGIINALDGMTFDVIVPVPISEEKRKQRGYNQAQLIASRISETTEVCEALIHKETLPQKELDKQGRAENAQMSFETEEIFEEVIKGKTVLLVDDVRTSGVTLNACAVALLEAGAAKVYAAVAAAVPKRT